MNLADPILIAILGLAAGLAIVRFLVGQWQDRLAYKRRLELQRRDHQARKELIERRDRAGRREPYLTEEFGHDEGAAFHPVQLRYYYVGEYGSRTYRPHYHLCLFGADFDDKQTFGKSKGGYALYDSKTLDRLWGLGMCTVQDMVPETASYAAGYCTKKRDAKRTTTPATNEGARPYVKKAERAGWCIDRVTGEAIALPGDRTALPGCAVDLYCGCRREREGALKKRLAGYPRHQDAENHARELEAADQEADRRARIERGQKAPR